jgi:hypothetical protein
MRDDVPNAHVAQLVEHVLGKDEVTRSIRVVGSMPCLTRAGATAYWGPDQFVKYVGSWI